jgi:eukaryotic-like serine/threonine-protein kinase
VAGGKDQDQPGDAAGGGDAGAGAAAATMALEAPADAGAGAGPERLGRYIILDRLGAGGMGTVYSAYDPELDRRVAVKLLHLPGGGAAGAAAARDRLLREAQAMARLAHPNVIAVYDVGTFQQPGREPAVFFAMERVLGGTLRAWLARGTETTAGGDTGPQARPRRWREVVAVFVQAGRGLAAAHRAGLIHRDFKPDNVLLGQEGRVRVTDFGVARAMEGDQGGGGGGGDGGSGGGTGAAPVTRSGALVGTPGYLAPEQLEGPVTARSDQFSFCVALFEGLTGQRPFTVSPFHVYSEELRTKAVQFPAGADAPGFVRAAVLRGLEKDPARRWETMEALLEALGRDPRARRARLVGGAALAAALALAGGRWLAVRAGTERACARLAGTAEASWQARRGAIAAAFTAAGGPFAADLLGRVDGRLGAFARAWGTARGDVCRGRAALPRARLAASGACLDHAAVTMDQAAALLARADGPVVQHAAQIVAAVPAVRDCLDAEALASAPEPPAAPARPAVAAARARLAQATILGIPHPARGIETIAAMLPEVERLGYAPLRAEALFLLGELQVKQDLRVEAERSLRQASELALVGRDDRLFIRAASRLGYLVGGLGEQPQRGRDWLALARQAFERAGRPAALAPWLELQQLGPIMDSGPWDECIATAERAVAGARRLGDPFQEAEASMLLTGCQSMTRPVDQLLVGAERALALYREAHGPRHPETVGALGAVAYYHWLAGDLARAHAETEEVVAGNRALGVRPATLAFSLAHLGDVLFELGRFDEALARRREGLAMLPPGKQHRFVAAELRAGLAASERRLGNTAAALAHARAAAAACADAVEHWSCAPGAFVYAQLLLDGGQRAAAAEQGGRALAGWHIPIMRRLRAQVEAWGRRAGLALAPPAKPAPRAP